MGNGAPIKEEINERKIVSTKINLKEIEVDEKLLKNPETWRNCSTLIFRKVFGEITYHLADKNQYPTSFARSQASRLALNVSITKAKGMMGLSAKHSGKRPTHISGFCVRGMAIFLTNPKIPSNAFFTPGRTLPIRLRHSNALGFAKDDASLESRGCSIKFGDSLEEAPLDLILNTGELSGFFNLETFLSFTLMQVSRNDKKHTEWLSKYPSAVNAFTGSYKRAPGSYADLHYYSQTCLEFIAEDGIKRYCKFRCVPYGGGPGSQVPPEASGLPDLADQLSLVVTHNCRSSVRKSNERRDKNYLRAEFIERLKNRQQEATSTTSTTGISGPKLGAKVAILNLIATEKMKSNLKHRTSAALVAQAASKITADSSSTSLPDIVTTNSDSANNNNDNNNSSLRTVSEIALPPISQNDKNKTPPTIRGPSLNGILSGVRHGKNTNEVISNRRGSKSTNEVISNRRGSKSTSEVISNRRGSKSTNEVISSISNSNNSNGSNARGTSIRAGGISSRFTGRGGIQGRGSASRKKSVEKAGVKYRLQIQIREWRDGIDTQELFNPNIAWNRILFPYLDLAILELYNIIPDIEMERMQFQIGRLPTTTLKLIEAHSEQDYNSINIARNEVYPFSQLLRLGTGDVGVAAGDCKYIITLYTGDCMGAKTSGKVSLLIKGDKGETTTIILGVPDKRVSSRVIYNIDVGIPLSIRVGHDGPGYAGNWFCEGISIWSQGDVDYNGESKASYDRWFPYYGWIVEGEIETFFECGRGLPQKDTSPNIINDRRLYLSAKQHKWKWNGDNRLPQRADFKTPFELPINYRFPLNRLVSFGLHMFEGKFNAFAAKIAGLPKEIWQMFESNTFSEFANHFLHFIANPDERLKSMDDITQLFQTLTIPEIPYKRWNTDEEFGRQMLNGANPCQLKRCDAIPANFGVTPAMVQPLMPEGSDLLQEIAAGFVYIADCEPLSGISTWDGTKSGLNKDTEFMVSTLPRYLSPAIALFHVARSGKLLPIAIQLYQEPGSTVWTPLDSEAEWLFAKLFYKVADSNMHQMVHHLLETHLITESIAVASIRQLAPCHPVMKLFHHHFICLMAINTLGRNVLVAAGGVSDITLSIGGGGHIDLMSKYYTQYWDYNNLTFPARLRNRGVDDPSKLPGYYYRDDGMALWNIIEKYVRSFLQLFYLTVEDVEEDTELQAWIHDLHNNGLHSAKNVPEAFHSLEEVIDCVAGVIWQCVAGHSSVNFSQYEHFSFVPNAPLSVMIPPPKVKGTASMDKLFDLLPTRRMVAQAICTGKTLSNINADDRFIGDFHEKVFNTGAVEKVVATFQDDVTEYAIQIKERNAKLLSNTNTCFENPYDVPYMHLTPNRMPNSVAL